MIRVEGCTKRFGRTRALEGVTFELAQGEAGALWGTNGAGKTTLIRCVLGVVRHGGRVTIGGMDARRGGKRARSLLGYVPQELPFQEDARMLAAARFFAAMRGVEAARTAAMLERVGLAAHAGKRLRELSGGMKQRFALALALLSDPALLVLDEPTSNLDAAAQADIVDLLRECRGMGKTILFASHRAREVSAVADRVLTLERGRLVSDEGVEEFARRTVEVATMRLGVRREAEAAALEALRAGGFDAQANGHGLCVRVSRGEKARPIEVLARADIAVTDFELLGEGAKGEEVRP